MTSGFRYARATKRRRATPAPRSQGFRTRPQPFSGAPHTSRTPSVASTFHAGAESTPLTPCSALTMRTPMTTRARDRRRTWRHTCAPGLPATQPPAERERDGDPDDEEEGREDEVRDRHPVEVGGPVAEKRGRPGDAGDLVHEQHEEDVGPAEKIDREDARGAGSGRGGGRRSGQVGPPRMSHEGYPGARGHTMPSPSRRRNGSQGLPGASRRGAARLGRSCRGRGAVLPHRQPLRSRGRARHARPLAGPGGLGPVPALPRRGGRRRRRRRGARDDGPRDAGADGRGDDPRRVAALLRAARRGRHQGQRRRRAPRGLVARHRGRDLPPAHGGGRPALAASSSSSASRTRSTGSAIRRTSRRVSRSSPPRPATGARRTAPTTRRRTWRWISSARRTRAPT